MAGKFRQITLTRQFNAPAALSSKKPKKGLSFFFQSEAEAAGYPNISSTPV